MEEVHPTVEAADIMAVEVEEAALLEVHLEDLETRLEAETISGGPTLVVVAEAAVAVAAVVHRLVPEAFRGPIRASRMATADCQSSSAS